MRLIAAAIAVFCCAASAYVTRAHAADAFSDRASGFSITKPAGWHSITEDEIVKNRDAVRLKDSELQELIKRRPQKPLLVVAKHREPYPEPNPSISVLVKPISNPKTFDAVDALEFMVNPLKRAYDEFKVVQGPQKIKFQNWDAAHAEFAYTLKTPDGKTFPVATEMWLIPRGETCFIVSVGSSPNPKAPEHAEIAKAIKSIEIAPWPTNPASPATRAMTIAIGAQSSGRYFNDA